MTFEHSSDGNEHYTPPRFVESARKVMGSIDLDPASCQAAQSYIRAAEWCGLDHPDPYYRDGLKVPLSTGHNVFLNPPGGKVKGKRGAQAAHWWCVYRDIYRQGRIRSLFFMGFNLSLLRSTQNTDCPIIASDVHICVPKKRIRFLTWDGSAWKVGSKPKYDNLIVYCGPNPEGFREETEKYGAGL